MHTKPGADTGFAAVPVHPEPSTMSLPAMTTWRLSIGAGAGTGRETPVQRVGPWPWTANTPNPRSPLCRGVSALRPAAPAAPGGPWAPGAPGAPLAPAGPRTPRGPGGP